MLGSAVLVTGLRSSGVFRACHRLLDSVSFYPRLACARFNLCVAVRGTRVPLTDPVDRSFESRKSQNILHPALPKMEHLVSHSCTLWLYHPTLAHRQPNGQGRVIESWYWVEGTVPFDMYQYIAQVPLSRVASACRRAAHLGNEGASVGTYVIRTYTWCD